MVAINSKNAAEPKARPSEFTAANRSCKAVLYLDSLRMRNKRNTRKMRKSRVGKKTCKKNGMVAKKSIKPKALKM